MADYDPRPLFEVYSGNRKSKNKGSDTKTRVGKLDINIIYHAYKKQFEWDRDRLKIISEDEAPLDFNTWRATPANLDPGKYGF